MDLKAELLKEHSKQQCDLIVQYIGKSPERFASLMELFFSGPYRITQRAAWPMSYCIRNHPSLVKPYLHKLINLLSDPSVHNAVTRNITRLLQDIEIPKQYHGKIMSRCFEFIQSPEAKPAVKAFSLTILENLSHQYPGIIPEIRLIIEDRWPMETAAFRSRARKFIS